MHELNITLPGDHLAKLLYAICGGPRPRQPATDATARTSLGAANPDSHPHLRNAD